MEKTKLPLLLVAVLASLLLACAPPPLVVLRVFYVCTHAFCWSYGEEAHRAVSCDTVRAWLANHVSDSETANWVLTHTATPSIAPSAGGRAGEDGRHGARLGQ